MKNFIKFNLLDLVEDEVKNLNSESFLGELEKRKVKLEEIIILSEESEIKNYLVDELKIDFDFDVLYPEGGVDLLKYDEKEKTLELNGCRYLLKFTQKESNGDKNIWYSGYRDISNLEREIKFIDLESTL